MRAIGMHAPGCHDLVTLAVFSIPHHGVPLFRQVHPYLVLASGKQVDFQQADPFGLFQDRILRMDNFPFAGSGVE